MSTCGLIARFGVNFSFIDVKANYGKLYTLFQNGYHFRILLLVFKLALLASFLGSKFKRIFYLERGKKGKFECKQKNIKMAAIVPGIRCMASTRKFFPDGVVKSVEVPNLALHSIPLPRGSHLPHRRNELRETSVQGDYDEKKRQTSAGHKRKFQCFHCLLNNLLHTVRMF